LSEYLRGASIKRQRGAKKASKKTDGAGGSPWKRRKFLMTVKDKKKKPTGGSFKGNVNWLQGGAPWRVRFQDTGGGEWTRLGKEKGKRKKETTKKTKQKAFVLNGGKLEYIVVGGGKWEYKGKKHSKTPTKLRLKSQIGG